LSDLDALAHAVLADARATRRPPSAEAPLPEEPADLAALWALSDGVELADGTRILGRGEVMRATAWLVTERALDTWGAHRWVVGERHDLVIVRDLGDPGGVLETATDGLSALDRVAMDVIGYLADRLGLPAPLAPEREARAAAARGDADAIVRALARGFYPGAHREAWQAWLALGTLRAKAADPEGALAAFASGVEARLAGVPRGAEPRERAAAWKACAASAEKAGAAAVAVACRARAAG
jgi:hypothetical protein